MLNHDIEHSLFFDGDKFYPDKYSVLVGSHFPKGQYHEPSNCYDCCVVKFASERIQTLISQENGLRHNRITWFANIKGFLWLSFAAVISEKVGWDNGFWLMVLIPIIGICVCLTAISAIGDADHAVKLLLKKWRTIQEDQSESPYVVIPVIGLSYEEQKLDRPSSIPRWHFALYVLTGWIFGLIGVVLTKIGLCLGLSRWYYVLSISLGWLTSWEIVGALFKSEVRPSWIWKRLVEAWNDWLGFSMLEESIDLSERGLSV